VFDYLTANLDRVVNNMFNLQWNAAMMDSPAHNLERNSKTGNLVFLDNESGLFHSYRLLGRYSNYHDELLRSLCVFRKKTAAVVSRLHKSRDIGAVLQTTFERGEPLARHLPRIPFNNIQTLQSRIDAVYQQITHCQEKFPFLTTTPAAAAAATAETSASAAAGSINR
jgi:four-jointed box protein 1